MTPDNHVELHLRTLAEMTVMRALLTSLCRKSPDVKTLLADFEQRLEEIRGFEELRTGKRDNQFEYFAGLYSRSVVGSGDTPPPVQP